MIDAMGGLRGAGRVAERMAPRAFRLTGARTANLGADRASIQRQTCGAHLKIKSGNIKRRTPSRVDAALLIKRLQIFSINLLDVF